MTPTPNTITFYNSNVDWVMRITADRRIEVNEDVDVSEAAQKVLDAMQGLLTPQRTFVGLTDEDVNGFVGQYWGDEYMKMRSMVRAIEAKLKEKNT
jgi:hypothetical protein